MGSRPERNTEVFPIPSPGCVQFSATQKVGVRLVVEERIDRAGDHDVEIDEEHVAGDAGEIGCQSEIFARASMW